MARGEKPRYDGRWRPENAEGDDAAARRRAGDPLPQSATRAVVAWDDAVKGRIEIANAELDDLVIARADGTPTYNFCVVVDDIDMRITHVIRGDDHVNNTPRQINILRALGATPPVYAHLPTVLAPDGDKLSKRHGARRRAAVPRRRLPARSGGQLPRAARLGARRRRGVHASSSSSTWFDLGGLTPSPARFDPDKLKWLNHEHIKRLPEEELGARLAPFLERAGLDRRAGPRPRRSARCCAIASPTLVEMADAAHYFYATPHPAPTLVAERVTDAVEARAGTIWRARWRTSSGRRRHLRAAIKAAATPTA